MEQLWLLALVCVSGSCDSNSTYHSRTPYVSEMMCEEEGLKILRSSAGVSGRVAVCIKAVKPK